MSWYVFVLFPPPLVSMALVAGAACAAGWFAITNRHRRCPDCGDSMHRTVDEQWEAHRCSNCGVDHTGQPCPLDAEDNDE